MSAPGAAPRKRPEPGDRCYQSTTRCPGELVWTPLAVDPNHLILHCNACGRQYDECVISEEENKVVEERSASSDLYAHDGSFDEEWSQEVNWRIEELDRAGYSHDAAVVLGLCQGHEVDLHVARDLLKKGCPEELALQILL